MNQFCHNCGDKLEEGEVFCDQCGTRIEDVEPKWQQNSSESQIPNMHVPQMTPNQNYQQIPHVDPSNSYGYPGYGSIPPKKRKNILVPISIGVGVLVVVLVVVAFFAKSYLDQMKIKQEVVSQTNQNTENTSNNGLGNSQNKETTTSTTTNTQGRNFAYFASNVYAVSSYDPETQKITVKFQAHMENTGSGTAENIYLFFSPEVNDPNSQFLGIADNTPVNLTPLPQIAGGEKKLIEENFTYSNVSSTIATQAYLQDLSNRFIQLPILVKWTEGNQPYHLKLKIIR